MEKSRDLSDMIVTFTKKNNYTFSFITQSKFIKINLNITP